MASTKPARGTRDFLPADIRKREYVVGIIKEVYERYGFEPLETPAFENLETLTGKYGEEGNQLIFKILKRGEKLRTELSADAKEADLADLALRYDLTVPLARVVANERERLPKFFKRYQIQPVWRADRPARGRFREFYQCDVDCIGSNSPVIEAELISAVKQVLSRLGFADFIIRLNHREVLRGMLDAVGIADDRHGDALIALDKLDKIGSEGVLKEFAERGLIGGERLIALFERLTDAGNMSIIEILGEFVGDHAAGKQGLADLDRILSLAATPSVKIDASLARGLSYYTGSTMEINVPDLSGSLGGGGRYDGLIGMFGKEQIPACGFSLGLERILVVMEERGMFPPKIVESTPADVFVTIFSEETIADSLKLANELGGHGTRVTFYPKAGKEDKQWKYANSIKVPWIFTVNSTDVAEGMVSFQNLATRERFREPVDKAAVIVKEQLSAVSR